MQSQCVKCSKTVWSGGVELGNDLFCNACFAAKASEIQATREAAAQPTAPVKKARCEFYKAIQQFMAVARTLGLDTNNKRGCRIAIGLLLGRKTESRADLTGAEWGRCITGLRSGLLWW